MQCVLAVRQLSEACRVSRPKEGDMVIPTDRRATEERACIIRVRRFGPADHTKAVRIIVIDQIPQNIWYPDKNKLEPNIFKICEYRVISNIL